MADDLREKLGILTAKVEAAHHRLDKLQLDTRDDLTEIKKDLKEVITYMNKGKGWSAAMLLLAGSSGAGIVKLLSAMGGK